MGACRERLVTETQTGLCSARTTEYGGRHDLEGVGVVRGRCQSLLRDRFCYCDPFEGSPSTAHPSDVGDGIRCRINWWVLDRRKDSSENAALTVGGNLRIRVP